MKKRDRTVPVISLVAAAALAGLLVLSCAGSQLSPPPKPSAMRESDVLQGMPDGYRLPQVRVLLRETSLGSEPLTIVPPAGTTVSFDKGAEPGSQFPFPFGPEIRLRVIRDPKSVRAEVWADGTTADEPMAVSIGRSVTVTVPPGQALSLGNRSYEGAVTVTARADGWVVVNTVSMAQYVRGSLPSEMPASWPIEALKAQAVAIRTYTAFTLLWHGSSGWDKPWDVDDTTAFLRYAGTRGEDGALAEKYQSKCAQAETETAGQVLTYRDRVLKTYFHSTSGGQTASCYAVFGQQEIPPLAGVDLDDADESSPYHRWTKSFSLSDVTAAVRRTGVDAGEVHRISPDREDAAGYSWSVAVYGTRKDVCIRADSFRAALRGGNGESLPSCAFEASVAGNKMVFRGRGYGHGVGLDQYAAGELARRGKSCEDILKKMYRETVVTRIDAAQ